MKRVEVKNVSVCFGRVKALDDVRIELDAGRVCLMVGPNGAGKSTLMKVLLGLVRPDRGQLAVDGLDVPIRNAWKARIGYLPEAVAFSNNLSGRHVLRFFARARGVPAVRIGEVLEQVGLTAAGGRRVGGYSRGMRQRLGLAVAILSNPELLILDEPTSGLDQEGLGVLWRVLREWREAGRLVLVSSHDLALMERRIDELCVLRSGRLLAQGSKEKLREAAKLPHRIWLDVIGAKPQRVEALCAALSNWGRGRVDRFDDRLCIETPANSILEIMEIQRDFATEIRGLRVEEPSLDQVYEKLLECDP